MFTGDCRITIFTGNLGSGKTEVAINYALHEKKLGRRTAIVDLDIVNPYFRTRLVREQLGGLGLEVVCPRGPLAAADVPALSPAIKGVLENKDIYGVFDVGGDDVGATALGRFKELLPEGSHQLYFVVNACRPFTRDPAGVIKILRSVEKASKLKVTGLVSNTNLGRETDLQTVLDGHRMVREVAEEIGIPVAFLGARLDLVKELTMRVKDGTVVMPMQFFMRPPWQDGQTVNDPMLRIPQGGEDLNFFKLE